MNSLNLDAAELDAILRESEAQVPVAATLDEAAADPALTLDVARELLRDAAAGIRQLAARATPRTEPAEGREDDAWCAECGVKLEPVRPGRHQHPICSQAAAHWLRR